MLFLGIYTLSAQQNKPTPQVEKADGRPRNLSIRRHDATSVPLAANPFGLPSVNYKPIGALQRNTSGQNLRLSTTLGEKGLPIAIQGKTAASTNRAEAKSPGERALEYLSSLQLPAIKNTGDEFKSSRTQTDEQGNLHIRFNQQYKGVPVYGSEVIVHSRNDAFDLFNGRYYPTPTLQTIQPQVTQDQAIEAIKAHFGLTRVKAAWSAQDLRLVGGQPYKAELVVYHLNNDFEQEKLAWHIVAHPNLMQRVIYFVDAINGNVLHHYDYSCNFTGPLHQHKHAHGYEAVQDDFAKPLPLLLAADGPVSATGKDLFDQTRNFGAWQIGSQILLEDSSLPMFNSAASNMPNEPVGAIVTLDALNTSPAKQNFNYDFVKSGSTTFNNKKAVSAHYNAVQSYEYFRIKHSRKSIDGVNGNIISFINVAEDDGSSMENAFWNGEAMWYGNGGSTFKELARGLDVGGHEMTHGVIEKTANLEYQDESGALNESFADVFATMIDLDWLIGEDVMKPGITPNNCLRNMQDPHNNESANSPFYQPKHMSEKYTGSQDNGGVHINSGITNHAFYLFATNSNVGTAKAEKVYYKALTDYLVKSSQFKDCRIAVIQAATDLYGAAVAAAAAAAFDAVGITGPSSGGGSGSGGNYLGNLSPNPGVDFILCTSNDDQNLGLANVSGVYLGDIYTEGLSSRPSITDNGRQVVFVNKEGHIITIDLTYPGGVPNYLVNPPLSASPEWRNVAISKDGSVVAALTKTEENLVYVFDLLPPFGEAVYELVNPTYSGSGDYTDNVKYADVLEFDYSGEYLMYDAYNDLSNGQNDLSYWDIGILQYRENGNLVNSGIPYINKLFTGLPDQVSVGNPAFAKNSPYIVAFDYIDDASGQNDIIAANIETGDYATIVTNNGSLGWPNYNRLDKEMIYEGPNNAGTINIYKQGIKDNKIEGLGNEVGFVSNRHWGVWYGNGMRSLEVGTTSQQQTPFRVNVWPNPASDLLALNTNSEKAFNAQVQVVNLEGKICLTQAMDMQQGESRLDLNVRQLASGAYILRVITQEGLATMRFVKE